MTSTARRQPRHALHLLGIPASPGIAIGPAVLVDTTTVAVDRYHVEREGRDGEARRLEAALDLARRQLRELRDRVDKLGHRDAKFIIETQMLILEDSMLVEQALQLVQTDGLNAEWAIEYVTRLIKRAFEQVDDELIRERQDDVDAVCQRILRNLTGRHAELPGRAVLDGAIVVASRLSPAEVLGLAGTGAQGIALETGSATSHAAIVARSLELPAVVGVPDVCRVVRSGDLIALDGDTGEVSVRPEPAALERFERKRQQEARRIDSYLAIKDRPAETVDGTRIRLLANIDCEEELDALLKYGGEGVGLLRSEYLFLNRMDVPSEEEQYNYYRRIVERVRPRPATIRTLDLGADKLEAADRVPSELRPFSRLRAIRQCLRDTRLFISQLRAILRASHHGPVRILIPFVSSVDEVRAVRALLSEAQAQLRRDGIPFDENIPLGIMVEVPSAALTADVLAREVDFFSVGTNDLVQYTFATARQREETQYLYHPLHPAMLRLLETIAQAARNAGIPAGVCGEMAADLTSVPVLVALGFTELSMSPRSIPQVRGLILALNRQECVAWFEAARQFTTAGDVEGFFDEKVRRLSITQQLPALAEPPQQSTP